MAEPESIRRCIACKTRLIHDATRCPQCTSFQDWKQYLTFGNSSLSLLVALFSVLGIVIPTLSSLWNQGASLKLIHTEIQDNSLRTIITNSGGQDGFIKELNFSADTFTIFRKTKFIETVLQGSHQVLEIPLPVSVMENLSSASKCSINMTATDSDGNDIFLQKTVACDQQ